jgi:DNA-binding GntR family transcriptional regulator
VTKGPEKDSALWRQADQPAAQPLSIAGLRQAADLRRRSGLEETQQNSAVPDIPIHKEVLRDKIYSVLLAWIFEGTLKPGDKIVESVLARRLNVSRVPVRESLWLLAQRGLVTLKPHQGAFVTKLSGRDIREIFELRAILETHAAQLARVSLDRAGVARLKSAFENLADAARARSMQRFSAADIEFHKALWDLADNRHLTKILTDISTRFFGYELIRDVPQSPRFRFDAVVEQHRKMLQLVLSGAPEEIEAGFKSVFNEFLEHVLTRFGEGHQSAAETSTLE